MRILSESEIRGIKRILVIQLCPFGDVLLSTSYFETLKKKIPEVEISYLVLEPYQKIVMDHPYIDNLIVIPKSNGARYYIDRIKVFLFVRKQKYDLVIDQQNLPSSQQITFMSSAKHRFGYEDGRFNFAYNNKIRRGPVKYSPSKKFDMLVPLRLEEEKYKLHFHVDDNSYDYIMEWLNNEGIEKEKIITISPGSPVKKKKWDSENYTKLIDMITEQTEFTPILLWGPGEEQDVQQIYNAAARKPVIAPPTNLRQGAALLKLSRLLVCNDGGINHLAVATETKTIALFGQTEPEVWSPSTVFSTHHHLFNEEHTDISDNTFGIDADKVFKKLIEILEI